MKLRERQLLYTDGKCIRWSLRTNSAYPEGRPQVLAVYSWQVWRLGVSSILPDNLWRQGTRDSNGDGEM